jgi:thioredoxin reductase
MTQDFDVVIIGASFTGLTAALQLGRASRRTLVLDGGPPRNEMAPIAHGIPGFDGVSPLRILETIRTQLAAYPHVTIRPARAEKIEGQDGAFDVKLADAQRLRAKKIILTTGLRDVLPDLPGVRERWGKSVLNCPYCHGYEVKGQRLGVISLSPAGGLHHAQMLYTDWSQDLTVFTNGRTDLDADVLTKLARAGVKIVNGRVQAVLGEDTHLREILIEDGRRVPLDALFMIPPLVQSSPLAESLGCNMVQSGETRIVEVDALTGMTSVPGVYSGGDMTRLAHTVSFAIGDGARAGIVCHQALVAGREW